MPYDVTWYVEGRVVYSRMWGTITVDDFRDYMTTLFGYFDNSNALLVHNLLDSRHVTVGLSLRQIVGVVRKPHPRMGWNLEINPNAGTVRIITDMVTQLMGIRNHTFDNLEQALDFLKARDETIPWEKADSSVIS